jgi:hypothetical protein
MSDGRVCLILWGIDGQTWLDSMFDGKANDSARNRGGSLQLCGQDLKPHCNPLYDKKRTFWAYCGLCGGTEYNPTACDFLEVAKKFCGCMMNFSSLWHFPHGKPRNLYGNPIAYDWDFQRSTNHPSGKKHTLWEVPSRLHSHGIRNTPLCGVFLSTGTKHGRMWRFPKYWHLFHGKPRIRTGIPTVYDWVPLCCCNLASGRKNMRMASPHKCLLCGIHCNPGIDVFP